MASSLTSLTQSMGRTGRLYARASPKLCSSSSSYLSRSSISQVATIRYQAQSVRNMTSRNGLRSFSTTSARPAKTVQQMKSRQHTGPFSWKAALLFVLTGAGMIIYFRVEKARLERKRITEMSKGVGKPKVGGPFVLKDLDGKEFTAEDLKGKYSFVYFGFTHCPDICPDELDKMAAIIDKVKEASNGAEVMRPVFITCDPARDTPEVLKTYLAEFHPDIIGLTGTYEQVKQVCKAYRVYFSTPENVKSGEDYLVDHSIYFYLMDPEGDFVECVGRQDTPESATRLIMDHVQDWKREGKKLDV
ncbi:mitochondrial metallochaperone Sco1, putative [Talaromyces stipitatus ATCC 10500]|uniref:Mitochondrial metallochaperone Sco1, putative n=1 Tax=Talaromyces stipitatus (strain ATCC 10500 / CBS 375.48 / QM 6759 / NRRL 1006) TaxID=441959 RepID=B8MMG9_TALSN|nr:mitochondrial metallochaperone Sco1, putative [Talaromyces stipitatus ATCC 10500]EED13723.1 mitochondrial metallochaperone Sco1, putative [Talaromyces stipitatus ATCC 10500]